MRVGFIYSREIILLIGVYFNQESVLYSYTSYYWYVKFGKPQWMGVVAGSIRPPATSNNGFQNFMGLQQQSSQYRLFVPVR